MNEAFEIPALALRQADDRLQEQIDAVVAKRSAANNNVAGSLYTTMTPPTFLAKVFRVKEVRKNYKKKVNSSKAIKKHN